MFVSCKVIKIIIEYLNTYQQQSKILNILLVNNIYYEIRYTNDNRINSDYRLFVKAVKLVLD